MARIPRCLVASLDDPELDRDTRHHLARVLRLRPGAPIELVDGAGGLRAARWSGDARPAVDEGVASRAPPPADPLWLVVGPPRPSRLDWLVEKAAELGVDRLLLLRCEHAARSVGDARLLRLQRKAHEALLQCRRLHALEVAGETDLDGVLALAAAHDADLWVADAPPDGAPARDETTGPGALPPRAPGRPLVAVVGPEGGLSDDERARLADAGARAVHLGAGVLRVETAALALAARLAR